MSISIPEEYLAAAGMTEKDLKLEIALIFYQKKAISLGKAAELAGINRFILQKEMKKRRIPLNYDLLELNKDLKTIGL